MGETLETLLPEGSIRRGTVVAVSGHGSVTLAVALAAEASRRGSWVAAVGMADLGVAALAERGVDLERWALIDLSERGRDRSTAADMLGAVVGGFDLVLLGPGIRVAGATARRLLARMAVVAWAGPWPLDERWWRPSARRRQARFQLVLDDCSTHLCVLESGRWQREATYD